MTTEKEFWEFAGRYFRTVTSIKDIIDDLRVGVGLSKDVRAIKAMKRVENIMKDFDEQKPQDISIDEGCVGCAGPCKVVDVSANLQKELDTTRDMYFTGQKYIAKQNAEIKEYKATIEDQKRTIDHFIICIEDLEAEKDVLNDRIIEKALESLKLRQTNNGLMHANVGLEAELSARKQDSSVLMNVVLVLKTWNECHRTNRSALDQLSDIVKDYLDTPEGPPETPIDEPQEIEVTFTFMEITQEE